MTHTREQLEAALEKHKYSIEFRMPKPLPLKSIDAPVFTQ